MNMAVILPMPGVVIWQINLFEIAQPLETKKIAKRTLMIILQQQHMDTVLHPGGISNQSASVQ